MKPLRLEALLIYFRLVMKQLRIESFADNREAFEQASEILSDDIKTVIRLLSDKRHD